METITYADFIDRLLKGPSEFKNIRVVGDVDLQDIVVGSLTLDEVMFMGEVTGCVRIIDHILIRSKTSIYFADASPLIYTGSLLKDLAS